MTSPPPTNRLTPAPKYAKTKGSALKPIELWHGDCLDMMARIPDGSVNMVFADLPYGITARDWDKKIDMGKLWTQLLRVGMPTCAFIFTASQPFATDIITSARSIFKYDYIWHKNRCSGFMSAQKAPLKNHEHVLVFGKDITYNPQMGPASTYSVTKGKGKYVRGNQGTHFAQYDRRGGKSYPRSVQKFDEGDLRNDTLNGNKNKRIHPTQKPLSLICWLIKSYTNPGDTILDPTAGSLTTAVAAYNTGRRAICIEKDEGYYRAGVERFQAAMLVPKQQEMRI